MGGYLLFNIEFKSKDNRDRFEKYKFKSLGGFKRMFQYKDGEDYDCTYYPSWMGYFEPQLIIKECRKEKIKYTKFLSIDLSTQSPWFDEINQETQSD
jgi:hypothetical protein